MKPTSSPIVGQRLSLFQRLRLALTGPFYFPFVDPPQLRTTSGSPASNPICGRVARTEVPERRNVVAQPSTPPEPIGPQPVEILASYLALSPKTRFAIRSADEFVSTANDLRGQVLELIDHLFARYPVPLFLYRVMLSEAGERLVFPGGRPTLRTKQWLTQEAHLRRWFYAVAQGDSFAGLVKDTLRKREAHWFLLAPAHNDVATNLLWARVAALGFPPEACDLILQKFSYALPNLSDERKMDLARFYARAWPEIRPHERDEIADFVRSRLDDPAFCLAGRTAASVRRLSETWHRRIDDVDLGHGHPHGVGAKNPSWKESFPAWGERFGSVLVQAVELTSGRALREEGTHQGHCVGGYAEACQANRSRIVSLRWFEADVEITRLTVEVRPSERKIVQIRGRRNRRPVSEERTVILRWARHNGLEIDPYAS